MIVLLTSIICSIYEYVYSIYNLSNFLYFSIFPQTEATHSTPLKQKLPDGSPIIAILVVSCNRITVERCLNQLIKLRPSKEQFPIIVSQDCDHRQTADVIARYGNQLLHIKVIQVYFIFII